MKCSDNPGDTKTAIESNPLRYAEYCKAGLDWLYVDAYLTSGHAWGEKDEARTRRGVRRWVQEKGCSCEECPLLKAALAVKRGGWPPRGLFE